MRLTDLETKTAEMLKCDLDWPLWPLLPLKEIGSIGLPKLAYVHTDDKLTIKIGNVYAPSKDDKQIKYKSIDEIVLDWRVD